MGVGARVAEARNRKQPPWSQGFLARQVGVSREVIANIENDRTTPNVERLGRIADALGVSMTWLLGQSAQAQEPDSRRPPAVAERRIVPRAMRRIPVLATITAGEPWAQHADVEYEDVPDWGDGFERWGRVVEGTSMEPTLQHGDVAVFENRRAEPGHVVHAFRDGEDTVKCYRLAQGGQPALVPFNPEHAEIPIDGWQVKGVCVARIRIGPRGRRGYMDYRGGMVWADRLETD